ncbi:MAG: hypothetical protein GY950_04415, partial [bacterium]|nr:hypothetical protein [bacterium]
MNFLCRLLLILIVCTVFFLQLAALDPDKPMDEYLLDEWGMDKGLPAARVFITAQDHDGYLWIGTQNGLVRYDGVEFETIFLKDTWHPLHRWFSGLAVDRHGVVWFGGSQGVGQYKNGRIVQFPAEEISFENGALTVFEAGGGDIWIGGREKLVRFSNGEFTIFDTTSGLAAESIIQLAEDRQGVLWVGSIRGGLYYRQQDEFNRYIIEDFPGNYTPLALYVDRGGTLWIGTNQGLVGIARPLAEKNKGITVLTTRDGLCDNNVRSILEDSDGNLWLGTESGLNRVRKEPDGRMTTAKSLAGTSIGSLFEDREKSIWISTYYSGVKRLRDAAVSSFSQREGMPIHPVYLYKDDNKKIWMGSSMGALYRFDDGIFKEEKRLGHSGLLGINALVEDASGDLWLGTRGQGVFHLKGDRQVHHDFGDMPHSGVVNAALRDSRNKLWFGTFYGIRCYQNGVFRSYTTSDGLAANIIMNVYEDRQGNILLGTTGGLDILKKGQANRGNIENYLPEKTVAGIHEDRDGVLWLGSYASGLIRFKDKKAFFFGTRSGLGSNVIFQVIEDSRGKLWMSSINGILSASKKELNDVADGLKDKINCTVFGLSDGMISSECTMSAKYSIIETGKDEFWFATSRGVSVVKPGKIRVNNTPPPVVMKAALFNGEPVPVVQGAAGVSKEREFKGIQNIRFYFTAPTF